MQWVCHEFDIFTRLQIELFLEAATQLDKKAVRLKCIFESGTQGIDEVQKKNLYPISTLRTANTKRRLLVVAIQCANFRFRALKMDHCAKVTR